MPRNIAKEIAEEDELMEAGAEPIESEPQTLWEYVCAILGEDPDNADTDAIMDKMEDLKVQTTTMIRLIPG